MSLSFIVLSFKTLYLKQAKDQLDPAERTLDDAAAMIKPMKPQLDVVKNLLQKSGQQAMDALNGADEAVEDAEVGRGVSWWV